MHLTTHPRVGRTTVLQARLAAAEAALKAVDLQRHDLTAERSAWLDQLQQENVSLRGVYEEAKQAKERLVEVRARPMQPSPSHHHHNHYYYHRTARPLHKVNAGVDACECAGDERARQAA